MHKILMKMLVVTIMVTSIPVINAHDTPIFVAGDQKKNTSKFQQVIRSKKLWIGLLLAATGFAGFVWWNERVDRLVIKTVEDVNDILKKDVRYGMKKRDVKIQSYHNESSNITTYGDGPKRTDKGLELILYYKKDETVFIKYNIYYDPIVMMHEVVEKIKKDFDSEFTVQSYYY